MTVSLRADIGGKSGSVQLNGADKLTLSEDGSMAGIPAVTGAFKNLKASANGTNGTILVSADELVLSSASGSYKTLTGINLTGLAVTKTGVNGLDAGLLAANTWYSVWVIWNGTTVAGLLSLSETTPTLPAGYTHQARVGWVRTDGSGNKYPLSFKQSGRRVAYVSAAGTNTAVLPVMASGTWSNWTAVSVGSYIPPTASVIDVQLSGSYNSNLGSLAPSQNFTATGSGTMAPITNQWASATTATLSQRATMPLESSNIYVFATGTTYVQCWGWEDNL